MKYKNFCLLLVLALVLCFAGVSIGFVGYGSNLMGRYPEFSAYEPSKPIFEDELSIQMYKYDVEDYISEAERYLENAEADIQRIQEAMEDAVRKVNRIVDEYNTFIRTGY